LAYRLFAGINLPILLRLPPHSWDQNAFHQRVIQRLFDRLSLNYHGFQTAISGNISPSRGRSGPFSPYSDDLHYISTVSKYTEQVMKDLSKAVLTLVLTTTTLAAGAATTYEEAPVLMVTPIYHMVETTTPVRQCWEEEVVRRESWRRNDSATPSILGAVIGGALGNAVGHHKSNKRVGTVVGAILGSSIARDISRADNDTTYIDTVERCRTVQNRSQEEKLVGYDVVYSYNGVEHTVRLPEDPGASVRVRVNVEPVL
jgi:uncharacterized protein YcfJ